MLNIKKRMEQTSVPYPECAACLECCRDVPLPCRAVRGAVRVCKALERRLLLRTEHSVSLERLMPSEASRMECLCIPAVCTGFHY